jgi:hypothetical protein
MALHYVVLVQKTMSHVFYDLFTTVTTTLTVGLCSIRSGIEEKTLLNLGMNKSNVESRQRMYKEEIVDQCIETSVRNQCRCSFYCALLTQHVSVPIGGHLQVVWNTNIFEDSYCICQRIR